MSRAHSISCSNLGCDCCRTISENVNCTHISTVKRMKPSPDNLSVDQKKKRLHSAGLGVTMEKNTCIELFETWPSTEQVDFLCRVLSKMHHFQQSQVNDLLEPLLKRDFIVAFRNSGVPHLAESILSHLDAPSLLSVELVSKGWQYSVASFQLWRRLLLRRVAADPVWHGLAERRGWLDLIHRSDVNQLPASLEQRRIAMGLRQNLSDMPLLNVVQNCNAPTCSNACESQVQLPPLSSKGGFQGDAHVPGTKLGLHSNFCSSLYNHAVTSPEAHFQYATTPAAESCGSRTSCHGSFAFNMDFDFSDSHSVELMLFAHRFYKQLYPRIIKDIKRVEDNWCRGNYHLTRIPCRSDVTKGVYCLQYDNEKIVSGLRDDTIKVWRRTVNHPPKPSGLHSSRTAGGSQKAASSSAATVPVNRPVAAADGDDPVARVGARQEMAQPPAPAEAVVAGDGNNSNYAAENSVSTDGYQCTQVLEGHSGSVLCLQYIGNLLISGSSDTTVRLWDLSSGRCLNVISHHAEAVLHLRFQNNVLVTCSKDRSIAVWDMGPWPKDVQLRQVLVGHRAAVNVVDFDEKYIVSASGDRTIKVWATDTCGYVRTLTGHRRGIACLQYRDRLIVSGSSDNTIRIWDIETGVCFRVLEGHEELVRCIRFDSKRIVSGAYDGKIKIWNLKAALNPRSKPNQLCVHTLQQHTGRVFRLQFDDFQIVSSSHDDSILIWDFVRPCVDSEDLDDGYDDGINAAVAPQPMNCVCPHSSKELMNDDLASDVPIPRASVSGLLMLTPPTSSGERNRSSHGPTLQQAIAGTPPRASTSTAERYHEGSMAVSPLPEPAGDIDSVPSLCHSASDQRPTADESKAKPSHSGLSPQHFN